MKLNSRVWLRQIVVLRRDHQIILRGKLIILTKEKPLGDLGKR